MALRSDFRIHVDSARDATSERGIYPPPESAAFAGPAAFAEKSLFDSIESRLEDAAVPKAPGETPQRVAFLVTHGMGQQVPFETLSALGQSLVTQHTKEHHKNAPDPNVAVRRVRLTNTAGAPELSRVEVSLNDVVHRPVEAHLYEAYWAPLTEGQISFLQTVAFLYSSGWNGILTSVRGWWRRRGEDKAAEAAAPAEDPPQGSPNVRPRRKTKSSFDRWIFGEFHEMPVKHGTLGALVTVVAFVSLLLLPSLLLFTPLGTGAAAKIWHVYKDELFKAPHWAQALAVVIAVALSAIAVAVRYFVVEFVGDVAIYVSSYKVSRYDAIRNQILTLACGIARQIYSAGVVDQSQPPYDAVVIVGHSLGSVISYDILNAAINWDETECGLANRVVGRTTRLITFGSPLDKTAFLFRTQVSSARNLREALAARQQPLILDYQQYRPIDHFRWINIYSRRDYVSGHLDYYDVQLDKGNPAPAGYNRIENRIDPQAWIPGLAHVQYWNNEELHKVLYDAVWAGCPVFVHA